MLLHFYHFLCNKMIAESLLVMNRGNGDNSRMDLDDATLLADYRKGNDEALGLLVEKYQKQKHDVDHRRERHAATRPWAGELHHPWPPGVFSLIRWGPRVKIRVAAASIRPCMVSEIPSNHDKAIAAGMATPIPAAVVKSASQIPPAKAEGSADAGPIDDAPAKVVGVELGRPERGGGALLWGEPRGDVRLG